MSKYFFAVVVSLCFSILAAEPPATFSSIPPEPAVTVIPANDCNVCGETKTTSREIGAPKPSILSQFKHFFSCDCCCCNISPVKMSREIKPPKIQYETVKIPRTREVVEYEKVKVPHTKLVEVTEYTTELVPHTRQVIEYEKVRSIKPPKPVCETICVSPQKARELRNQGEVLK